MHSHCIFYFGKNSLGENIPFLRVTWVAAILKSQPREMKSRNPVPNFSLYELSLHRH